jgi:indolepyruvate ferredoxin oxidoreductase
MFARPDPVTGVPRKTEFGSWMGIVFRLLAPLRRIRGTFLDPFRAQPRAAAGAPADRGLLRARFAPVAVAEPSSHPLAVELASLPDAIRGYGHVKLAAVRQVRRREQQLMEAWGTLATPGADSRPGRASGAT